jgi:hypothetical protein
MSNELNVIINKKCETCDHKEVCRFQSDHMHTVIAKNTVEKALKDANINIDLTIHINSECKYFRKHETTGTITTVKIHGSAFRV